MRIAFVLAVCLFLALPVLAQENAPGDSTHAAQIGEARLAATNWLAAMDRGDVGTTWDTAAAIFKMNIVRPEWLESIASVRTPLGPFGERTFQSADFHEELPEAPPGPYVVFMYQLEATAVERVIETLIFTREEGMWKLIGYYINPAQ